MIGFRAPLMLEEETQGSLVLFPIYRKNSDVKRVGDFYQKDRVFILVYVKFFHSNRKYTVSSQDSSCVSNVQNVCGLVLFILFYSSLNMQSL
jgi:hypothetical protein